MYLLVYLSVEDNKLTNKANNGYKQLSVLGEKNMRKEDSPVQKEP